MKHWTVEYMLHVLETKDWSANRLAKEAGVATSTIARPIREDDYAYGLSAQTVSKIFACTGIDPRPFIPRGLAETGDIYKAAPPPRPSEPPPDLGAFTINEIKIAIVGPVAQIVATVDREGIAKLRRKLDAIESMFDSD